MTPGKRPKIHHNTIEVNFSIDFPFENDEDIVIAARCKLS